MVAKLKTAALVGAVCCLMFGSTAMAQQEQDVDPSEGAFEPVELFPDYLTRRILADDFESAVEGIGIDNAVLSGAKAWASMPVSVCFWGGSTDLRRRIVTIAAEWEASGSGIKFDFGDRRNPRLCDGRYFAQIRVGYSLPGYWSFIGSDSIVQAMQSETSLNLQGFDRGSVSNNEFRRIVLHEFGHAVGFRHEHQNPEGACEFNWDAVQRYLSGPPNRWTLEQINQNMRVRPYLQGDVATEFDPTSIMLYSFKPEFYVGGNNNPCYSEWNTSLSRKDLALAAHVYGRGTSMAPLDDERSVQDADIDATPEAVHDELLTKDGEPVKIFNASESFELIRTAIAASSAGVSPTERAIIEARLSLLEAQPNVQARTIGTVRPEYVDVDLFACSSEAATAELFGEMERVVSAQPYLGRVRSRQETFPGEPAVTQGINIVVDTNHDGEQQEGNRLVEALESAFPGKVQLVPNEGEMSRWYISIVACED